MSSLDWVEASVYVISPEKIGAFKILYYSILKDGTKEDSILDHCWIVKLRRQFEPQGIFQ